MSDTTTTGLRDLYKPEIECLQGDTNFYTWKSQATSHLRLLNLWDLVSGADPRPIASAQQAVWDSGDQQAKYFLTRTVDFSLCELFAAATTSVEIWNVLMDRFHRNDAASLLRCHRAILTLRYREGNRATIPAYLALFERHWTNLLDRTADADTPAGVVGNSLETTMAVFARSEEVKTEILVASLPASIRKMAAKLRVMYDGQLSYVHLLKLLRKLQIVLEEEEAAAVECTWCKKWGMESVGHKYRECKKLMEYKAEQRGKMREKKQRIRKEQD